jgi:hypothetical protein
MAEAFVSLKLTPQEFDLVRESVQFYADNEESVARDKHTDYALRHKARERAVKLYDLVRKIGG